MNQVYFKISPLSSAGSIVAFEFVIFHTDQAAIKVFDLAGRGTLSFFNQYLNAGPYRYLWDTHGFARGCWAVRLQAGKTICMKTVKIVY